MKGFNLYRVMLGYLAVIFVLCAIVVFDPLRWVFPGSGALSVPNVGLRLQADAPDPVDVPQTQGRALEAVSADTPAMQPTTVAQDLVAMDALMAGIVAEDETEVGEGDASATDVDLSPEAARIAGGVDVTYTVGTGDSLGALALRFYGDSALSGMIFQANHGLMGSPDQLRVGQVLIIPGRS